MNRIKTRALSVLCAVTMMLAAVPFVPVAAPVSAAQQVATTIFYEDFSETTMPEGWWTYDADGDGHNWAVSTNKWNGYQDVGYCVYSTSALSYSEYLTPDDWMMMPAVTLPTASEAAVELTFQVYTSYMPGYADYLQVYASTEPITDPTTLTADELVLDRMHYSDSDYELVTVDLNALRGETVYIAFRHHKATGVWQMYLDEVKIIAKTPKMHKVTFPAENDVFTVTPANGKFEATADLDYTFTVKVNDEYLPHFGTLTVTANDKVLVGNDGVYTIPAVTERQKVDISFAYRVGDVKVDNDINMLDVMTLYKHVSGGLLVNGVQAKAGDINDSGTGNMSDVLILYNYLSGKRSYLDENRNIDLIWQNAYADATNGFASKDNVTSSEYIFNNKSIKDYSEIARYGDSKFIFYNDKAARVVNVADGYAMTLPATTFKKDYSLSELRSRYTTDDFVLNVSYEHQNPYGNTSGSWNTYLTEWLNRYIADDSFLSRNNITRVRATTSSTSKLAGYTVLNYDLFINDSENVEMPYYHIAIIRKSNEYVKFYMLVMKSTTNRAADMDAIVKSFKEVTTMGTAKNTQGAYELEIPDYWSTETTAYYNKLMSQSATDWGFFSTSMVDSSDSSYYTNADKIQSEYDRLSNALDYDYEIMPTYTHIAWQNDMNHFPLEHATRFAGGNGFNGKPVLQFTYQFTTSNNTNLAGYTPMFDILRGEYEEHFRKLARDIKSYGKPVLFRLNNEMNTDWTSYAGIVTLCDPDIFVKTWEYLYEIFLEEGVDNCIWIFNPFATTTPYCDWGEDLCYMPSPEYVQVIGLTAYENANGATVMSFEEHYRKLYEKNTPYFDNYPAIISEFAVGAGGERQYSWGSNSWVSTTLGRNAAKQAQWVTDMFNCFAHRDEAGYEFVKNIKGAVWFSCNDYTTINGTSYITNYLKLDDSLTATLAALKKGLANEK